MERIEIKPTKYFEDAVKEVLERAKLMNQRAVAFFDDFIIDSDNGYYKNIDLYYVYKARQKKYDSIDWEQRRYEIAKSAMVGLMAGHNAIYEEKKLASIAMQYTDALINELKKKQYNPEMLKGGAE